MEAFIMRDLTNRLHIRKKVEESKGKKSFLKWGWGIQK